MSYCSPPSTTAPCRPSSRRSISYRAAARTASLDRSCGPLGIRLAATGWTTGCRGRWPRSRRMELPDALAASALIAECFRGERHRDVSAVLAFFEGLRETLVAERSVPGPRCIDKGERFAQGAGAVAPGAPQVERCWWAGEDPLYIDYHDREWGFPVADDRAALREDLPRRLSVRPELAHDPRQARRFPARHSPISISSASRASTTRDIERLSPTPASFAIAARSSRRSTTRSARVELRDEFGSLAAYFWRFEPAPRAGRSVSRARCCRDGDLARVDRAVQGPEAARLDVRRPDHRSTRSCRRWGSSTITSHRCHVRAAAEQARDGFDRPRARQQ